MKKTVIGFVFLVIFLIVIAIFAQSISISSQADNESSTVSGTDIGAQYVQNFVEKKGIEETNINNVTKVDLNELPDGVEIHNVKDTNVGIYEINYNDTQTQTPKNVFVVSYSTENIATKDNLIVDQQKREFLQFGYSGETNVSSFLMTSTNVQTSKLVGYVMMRKGSITGMSTNIEVTNPVAGGTIELMIYKNGVPLRFGNAFATNNPGIQVDYDIQSNNVDTFEPGDVISIYLLSSDGVAWKNAITTVEITTD